MVFPFHYKRAKNLQMLSFRRKFLSYPCFFVWTYLFCFLHHLHLLFHLPYPQNLLVKGICPSISSPALNLTEPSLPSASTYSLSSLRSTRPHRAPGYLDHDVCHSHIVCPNGYCLSLQVTNAPFSPLCFLCFDSIWLGSHSSSWCRTL